MVKMNVDRRSIQATPTHTDPTEALLEFTKVLETAGLIMTGLPDTSGKIVRVTTSEDKRHQKSGWYVCFDGEVFVGAYGHFKTGLVGKWSSVEPHSMSAAQIAEHQRKMKIAQEQREVVQQAIYAKASQKAEGILRDVTDGEHPYAKAKNIEGLFPISNNQLVIPAYDEHGNVSTIQFISPDGTKKFLTGGRKKGCYHQIKGDSDTVYVCEGWATGCTINEATGMTVAVAFDAGNLMPVAENVRSRFPNSSLVIAGDDDHEKEVNVGRTKAEAVAATLGLRAVFPYCSEGESDFNDVCVKHGIEVVRQQLTIKVDGRSEPLPLRPKLPAKMPYPIKALGKIMNSAAKQIAFKIQVPEAIAAQSVLANASLAVQGHYDVEMLHGDIKPTSMYFLSILHSGGRKSASDGMAGKVIKDYEQKSRKNHNDDYRKYLNSLKVWQAEHKQILNSNKCKDKQFELNALGAEPAALMSPVLTIPEPTAEALQKCLGLERPSLGLFSDEGGQFIGGYANGNERQLATATILSSIWDGQAIKRNRVIDGSSVFYGRRLAIHLMVQDGIANIMMGNEQFRNQGILARFLISEPEPLIGTRFHRETGYFNDDMELYYNALMALFDKELPIVDERDWELKPKVIKLSKDAKIVFATFHDEIEERQAPEKDLNFIADFASKLTEHAVRLSAVIQVVDGDDTDYISTINAMHGISLARYYLSETVRIRKGAVSEDIIKAELLLTWLKDNWAEEDIYLSPIMNSGPNSLRLKKTLMSAIRVLEDHKYLVKNEEPKTIDGSIRKETWKINYR